ncbi:outer membrane protein transport protein [Sulfurimonas sp. HSL-3221]|uniref:OmpP1/FadL family transporter n=1 Tax=Sulfurimonadaceae TaxID=2771471 RepID=UPI001E5433D4|nr:outer membrane protein transport protein [Sulfurimonas sp. HSL-3221]UFS62550.1 outer membrane protein transport protein [Sulfurimonas sp. HSL-3221]
MNKSTRLALAAVTALGATSAFATNGDHLIGLGAKARGMGGIGIGLSHGAESALANPAMITEVPATEISFGGTIFMPDVKYDGGAGYQQSDADLNVIPEVSIAAKINDNLYLGVGMWGTGGMGTDYREDTSGTTMQMVTNLQLMQFGVPVAYTSHGFSIGATAIIQYGALDINYNNGSTVGSGIAQDIAFGYTLGASYDLGEAGITGAKVGLVYKSAITMDYKDQLTNATAPFATAGVTGISSELEQPVEYGAGLSYTLGSHTAAFDYKRIAWSDAKGYKDFGWSDQDVFMIGYEFTSELGQLRAGYNYAKSPIKELDWMSNGGAALNMFNLLGFPATVEQHFTVGGTYHLNETLACDLAIAYAPEVEERFTSANLSGPYEIGSKHSQSSVSMQVTYAF